MSKIKKFIFYILMWAVVFAILLGLAIRSPEGIILNLLGYEIRTSVYFLTLFCLTSAMFLWYSWRLIRAIKNSILFVYGWITGRSRERAEKALLLASLYRVMGKNIQCAKTLRQAERYFKDSPEAAFLRLSLFEPSHILYDKNKEILRNNITATSFYDYIVWQEQIDKNSIASMDYLEKTGLYRENIDDFLKMVELYLKHNRSKAEFDKLFRHGRVLLNEVDYKIHDVYSSLIFAKRALYDKNPATALKLSEYALKIMPDSHLAFAMNLISYKACLKENKANRLLSEKFAKNPDFLSVKLFLDMRYEEKPEALAKRIADIPRQKAQEQAFLALQAYQFALARDIFSLKSVLKQAELYNDSLWMKVVNLLVDSMHKENFYSVALTIFRGVIDRMAFEQILREIESSPSLYHDYLSKFEQAIGFHPQGEYELVCETFEMLLHPNSIKTAKNPTIEAVRLYEGDFSSHGEGV